jgi:hypothetical protein
MRSNTRCKKCRCPVPESVLVSTVDEPSHQSLSFSSRLPPTYSAFVCLLSAKEIMSQPKEVLTLEGRRQPLICLVDYVSFSAHVDFVQVRRTVYCVDWKPESCSRLERSLAQLTLAAFCVPTTEPELHHAGCAQAHHSCARTEGRNGAAQKRSHVHVQAVS